VRYDGGLREDRSVGPPAVPERRMPSPPGQSGTLNGPVHTWYDPGDQGAGPTARWAFTGPVGRSRNLG